MIKRTQASPSCFGPRQRASYTDGCHLLVSSGRSITALAKKLGLHDLVLRRWVVKFRQSGPRRPTLAYDSDQAAETALRCAAGSRCRALSHLAPPPQE